MITNLLLCASEINILFAGMVAYASGSLLEVTFSIAVA